MARTEEAAKTSSHVSGINRSISVLMASTCTPQTVLLGALEHTRLGTGDERGLEHALCFKLHHGHTHSYFRLRPQVVVAAGQVPAQAVRLLRTRDHRGSASSNSPRHRQSPYSFDNLPLSPLYRTKALPRRSWMRCMRCLHSSVARIQQCECRCALFRSRSFGRLPLQVC